MKRKVKKKARPKKIIPELSLDDIYPEFLSIEMQLLGLAKLFVCASADEFGKLDLDPAMNGIGELLKDYAEKIARLNASRIADSKALFPFPPGPQNTKIFDPLCGSPYLLGFRGR